MKLAIIYDDGTSQGDMIWNSTPEEADWNWEEIFLSQRMAPRWNKLSETVVMAECVNIFKSRLDRCEEWDS